MHVKLLSSEAIFQPKMQHISFSGRTAPGPPDPLAGLRGPTSTGRGVEGKKKEGGGICLLLIFLLAMPLHTHTVYKVTTNTC